MPALEGLILLGALAAATPPSGPSPVGLLLAAADTQEVALPSGFSYPQLRRYLDALRPRSDTAGAPADASGSSLEIAGLIIDETVTKAGRDFYDVFHGVWTPPAGFRHHTIRIQEQPVPSLGTRVVLLLDGEPLLQLQLQPRYDFVEETARQAAEYTAAEIERRSPRAGPEAAGSPGGREGGEERRQEGTTAPGHEQAARRSLEREVR